MAHIHAIDDDPELLAVIALALEEAGHTVHPFQDGAKALAALTERLPDVLVLDILMPGTDGIELIRATRRLQPALPIIAISGGGSVGVPGYYLKLAHSFGATALLQKPFRMAELVRMVESLVGDRAHKHA